MKKIPLHPGFPVSQKIYSRLLLAYPRSHRAKYGAEMAQLFRDQCRDAWNESRTWGLFKLWLRVLPDLACTSIWERLAAMNERKSMTDKLANLFGFRTAAASTFLKFFSVVFLLVVATSVAITFILPTAYASTARIKVEPEAVSGISSGGGSGSVTPASYDPYFIQTAFEIIRDRVVLAKVIQKLNLNVVWGKRYNGGVPLNADTTMKLLKQRLSLDVVRNTKLIEITVYDENKNEAALIANAIVQSYRDYRVQLHNDAMVRSLQALENQNQQDEMQIRKASAEVEALRQKYKIGSDISTSRTPQAQPYWDKKHELDKMIEFHKMLAAKINVEKLEENIPKPGPVEIVREALPGHWPVRPNKPLNITLGVVAGFFLASVAGTISALIVFQRGKQTHNPTATGQ